MKSSFGTSNASHCWITVQRLKGLLNIVVQSSNLCSLILVILSPHFAPSPPKKTKARTTTADPSRFSISRSKACGDEFASSWLLPQLKNWMCSSRSRTQAVSASSCRAIEPKVEGMEACLYFEVDASSDMKWVHITAFLCITSPNQASTWKWYDML